jgi:hypothetical protein
MIRGTSDVLDATTVVILNGSYLLLLEMENGKVRLGPTVRLATVSLGEYLKFFS